MDNLIIISQVGIGKIKLGMSRDEVHKLMGTDLSRIKNGNIVCDTYFDSCFRIEYDNNIVNFIEIVNSITKYYHVVFEEVDIFNTTAKNLVSYAQQFSKYLDTPSAQAGFMYIFEDIGMSLYRSNVFKEETMNEPWFLQMNKEQKEDELRWQYFESVSIWSKGYYDSVNLFL